MKYVFEANGSNRGNASRKFYGPFADKLEATIAAKFHFNNENYFVQAFEADEWANAVADPAEYLNAERLQVVSPSRGRYALKWIEIAAIVAECRSDPRIAQYWNVTNLIQAE